MIERKLTLLYAIAWLTSTLTLEAGIVLTEGTALGIDYSWNRIVQYDSSGSSIIATLNVQPSNGYVGIAIAGDEVYLVDSSRNVFQIDLITGARNFSFYMPQVGGVVQTLGSKGDNLITVTQSTWTLVHEYSTDGTYLGATNTSLSSGAVGLESDGERYYTAQAFGADAGSIRVYDSNGNYESTIPLGLFGLSGLAFDAGTETFWVSTGSGDDRIRRYSMDGTLLSSMFAGSPNITGLAVVNTAIVTSTVPEPASIALFGLGSLGMGVIARRRKNIQNRLGKSPADSSAPIPGVSVG